jgi:DNA repair protein RadA/Sms
VFLENRQPNTPGSAVFAGIEGTRPVLVEIQSLVAPSPFAAPKRTTLGWDVGRLSMIIAVLEARFGIPFSGKDVYLNIAGGLKITEPAADLAVAASLLSSLANQALPEQTVIFGEVGLSGEVRAVSQKDARLKEAKKLGFEAAFLPQPNKKNEQSGITEKPFSSLQELITLFEGLQREGRS